MKHIVIDLEMNPVDWSYRDVRRHMHEEVIEKVIRFAGELNFIIKGLTFSPVKGPEGNIEYLLYIEKSEAKQDEAGISDILNDVKKVVKEAENTLNKGEE